MVESSDVLLVGRCCCCCCGGGDAMLSCGMPCIMGMPIGIAPCMLYAWKSMGCPPAMGMLMGPYWEGPIMVCGGGGADPIMYGGTPACVGDW